MKFRATKVTALALGLSVTLAHASTLRVTVLSYPPFPGSLPIPTISPDSLSPKHEAGDFWKIAFKDPEDYLESLSISISPGSSGYGASDMAFDVPYFGGGATGLQLAAALVKDDTNDRGMLEFLRGAGARDGVSENILFNERARLLWNARDTVLAGGEVQPSQDDAKVAFWLLQSSAVLVTTSFMQIDASTQAAQDWMKAALSNPNYRYLFSKDGVVRKDVQESLNILGARNAYVYNRIVQRLGEDIDSGVQTKVKAACARADKLNDFFAEADDVSEYEGQYVNSLVASKYEALCLARAFRKKLDDGQSLSQDETDRARTAIQSVQKAVDRARKAGRSPDVQKLARDAAADLAHISGI